MLFSSIDWSTWTPTMRATLIFVEDRGKLLLIRKLTGLGKGLINAPGGKIEPGETPAQGAIRECIEELSVTPLEARWCGELSFQFVDGLRLHCHVFHSRYYSGTPTVSREAKPLWVDRERVPYGEMWADDRIWLPWMLDGRSFHLKALFSNEDMLGHAIEPSAGPSAGPQG